jgi:hypothetical protein
MTITAKEASKLSGKSITWLRTHECMWCNQSALNSLRYGCGAIYEKCEPRKRMFNSYDKAVKDGGEGK